MVSEETALKIFPVWLASVLNSMWRTKDPIVVGGSFIPYVLGYLTWYNDIDIFLSASYFPKFLSLFKDETKIIIMADYSEFDEWGVVSGKQFMLKHVSSMDLDFGRMAMFDSTYWTR